MATDQTVFYYACRDGDHRMVEQLLKLEGVDDVHAGNAFRIACAYGHLEMVELLLRVHHDGPDRHIDVHANNEWAFRNACQCGHRSVVELLLSLEGDRRVDVHALDDYAFRDACVYGHSEVIDLLLSLAGDRAIPGRLLTKYGVRDVCKRMLIAEWACKRARGNAQHVVLRGLDRPTLAEVLRLLMRP